jgi:hypothetical protein
MVSLLKVAGISSGCVAASHVLIILRGGPAYRYFGAGEQMARLAEQGSAVPALVTGVAAVVFATWAAYALAGVGMLKRPPFLRTGQILIGAIYVLRGILIGPQLVWWLGGYRHAVAARQLLFSLGDEGPRGGSRTKPRRNDGASRRRSTDSGGVRGDTSRTRRLTKPE